MRAYRLLFITSILVQLAVPAAAQQGIMINHADYGVQPRGPMCDATDRLARQCDGKEGCQVYVDPRYLCPDPAYGRPKSVVLVSTCNGKTETRSYPDGAQIVLRCPIKGGSGGSTPSAGNAGGGNAGGQGGLQVSRATYGVQPSGPSCDATRQLQQQCNGKDGCQVYVDPRYLCPDPAFRREKSVVVVYSCNGRTDTKSFPDTAQLVLRCPAR